MSNTIISSRPAIAVTNPAPATTPNLTPPDPDRPPVVAATPHVIVAANGFGGNFARGDTLNVRDLPPGVTAARVRHLISIGALVALVENLEAEFEAAFGSPAAAVPPVGTVPPAPATTPAAKASTAAPAKAS